MTADPGTPQDEDPSHSAPSEEAGHRGQDNGQDGATGSASAIAMENSMHDKKWWEGSWNGYTAWALWLYVLISLIVLLLLWAKGYIDFMGNVRYCSLPTL